MSLRTILSSTAAQAAVGAAAPSSALLFSSASITLPLSTTEAANAESSKGHGGHETSTQTTSSLASGSSLPSRGPNMQGKSASVPPHCVSGKPACTSFIASATRGGSKGTRDTRRRATHSQIERRRREKINDRLITLRNLVPACAAKMDEKNRGRSGYSAATGGDEDDEDEDGPDWVPGGPDGAAKRKRKRRNAWAVKVPIKDPAQEEELGLHKLDVLTHTIDYILELHTRIEELETGRQQAVIKTVDKEREEDEEPLRGAQIPVHEQQQHPKSQSMPTPRSRQQQALSPNTAMSMEPGQMRQVREVGRSKAPSSDEETVSDGLTFSDMELDALPPLTPGPPPTTEQVSGPGVSSAGEGADPASARTRTFVHPPRHTIRVPRRGTAPARATPSSTASSSEERSPPTSGTLSAVSSASLSTTTGSTIMAGGRGYHQQNPSPMILPLPASAGLPSRSLTSPMMTLWAGLPILQSSNDDPGNLRKNSASFVPFAGVHPLHLAAPGASPAMRPCLGHGGHGNGTCVNWPELPPPMVALSSSDPFTRRSSWQQLRESAAVSDSRTTLPGSPHPPPSAEPASGYSQGRAHRGRTEEREDLNGDGSGCARSSGADTSAAHLLLNIGASPEALPPQTACSASRSAGMLFSQEQSHAGQQRQQPGRAPSASRRQSIMSFNTTALGYVTPQVFLMGGSRQAPYGQGFGHAYAYSPGSSLTRYNHYAVSNPGSGVGAGAGENQFARVHAYPASAPGGARAQRSGFAYGLASPPLFALSDSKALPEEEDLSLAKEMGQDRNKW